MAAFRDLLRGYREQRGLTQEDLANLVDPPLSADTISNIERGKTRPYRHTVAALCLALDLDDQAREEIWAAWREASRHGSAPGVRPPVDHADDALAFAQLTPLIGRTALLATLQQRLERSSVRMLTLAGPGGVGKTRLAIALMERLRPQFARGARFVDLSPVHASEHVLPTLARALQVHEGGTVPLREQLRQVLSGQQLLLVLDNFEQVLDAAAEVATLLGATDALKVVVTSREPLRVRSEHVFVVPPLGLPERLEVSSLEAIRGAPAVELFLDRAYAADASFSPSDASAQTIATLCTRLDGLPLALELAAARVRSLTPGALLAHFDRRLDLLSGARDAPLRQQSLRATLQWSYDLLSPVEQTLFRQLGVLVGAFGLDVAEALNGGDPAAVLPCLLSLVDKNLVRQDAAADGSAAVYRLLETVRAYGLEQLRASGEYDVVAAKHAAYYLNLAERAAHELDGPRQVENLDELESGYDNIHAALGWLLQHHVVDDGLRLACALTMFWLIRSRVSDGRFWFESLLHRADWAAGDGRLHARALNCAGRLCGADHDDDHAKVLHQQALELARQAEDAENIALALRRLAVLAGHTGDVEVAQKLFEQALTVSRTHGMTRHVAETLQELGETAIEHFQDEAARHALHESLELFQQLGDQHGLARVQFGLGILDFSGGDTRAARSWLERSLALYTRLNDLSWMAAAALHLGLAVLYSGERALARELLLDALEWARDDRDDHGVAQVLEGLAVVAAAEGEFRRALILEQAAAEIRSQLGLSVTAWERRWLEAGLAPARAEQPKALPLPQLRFEEAVQYAFGRNGFEASRS